MTFAENEKLVKEYVLKNAHVKQDSQSLGVASNGNKQLDSQRTTKLCLTTHRMLVQDASGNREAKAEFLQHLQIKNIKGCKVEKANNYPQKTGGGTAFIVFGIILLLAGLAFSVLILTAVGLALVFVGAIIVAHVRRIARQKSNAVIVINTHHGDNIKVQSDSIEVFDDFFTIVLDIQADPDAAYARWASVRSE